MSKENYRQISFEEAFGILHLHPINAQTFCLANLIIHVNESKGLKITYVQSGRKNEQPEFTTETDEPFEYENDGVRFILKNVNGKLKVYKENKTIHS